MKTGFLSFGLEWRIVVGVSNLGMLCSRLRSRQVCRKTLLYWPTDTPVLVPVSPVDTWSWTVFFEILTPRGKFYHRTKQLGQNNLARIYIHVYVQRQWIIGLPADMPCKKSNCLPKDACMQEWSKICKLKDERGQVRYDLLFFLMKKYLGHAT